MLFYAKRPSRTSQVVRWDSHRNASVPIFTRFGRILKSERAALAAARRCAGRAYAYDGSEVLLQDYSGA